MNNFSLYKSIAILFFCFLVIGALYFARDFLIPVTFGGILAMLFIPLSGWLEKKGVNRALASIICILILLSAVAVIIALLSWQASNLTEDISQIQQRVTDIINQLRQYISQTFGISNEEQKQILKNQSSSASGKAGSIAQSFFGSIMSLLVNIILVLVYIFLFMYFRTHLKKFVLMLVPETNKAETNKVIEDAGKVAQQYLTGLSGMIVMLWIMYGIGFSIVGVKSAIFFAILCGLLEIVPFVGNITGTSLTVLMVVSQGGSGTMVLGVLATYLLVQFIQTYILEPLVVGSQVNINPLFTILILVAMEMVWGIAGMVLAIPLLGIVKIICDHVEPLKPYGFLIGNGK